MECVPPPTANMRQRADGWGPRILSYCSGLCEMLDFTSGGFPLNKTKFVFMLKLFPVV